MYTFVCKTVNHVSCSAEKNVSCVGCRSSKRAEVLMWWVARLFESFSSVRLFSILNLESVFVPLSTIRCGM